MKSSFIALVGVAALALAGCSTATPPVVSPSLVPTADSAAAEAAIAACVAEVRDYGNGDGATLYDLDSPTVIPHEGGALVNGETFWQVIFAPRPEGWPSDITDPQPRECLYARGAVQRGTTEDGVTVEDLARR